MPLRGECVSQALKDCNRPILLKKSAMVFTTEKYALEIEIFTLSRGLRTQISRSCTLKRRFQQSVCGQSGRIDFFNRIDPNLTVATDSCVYKIRGDSS